MKKLLIALTLVLSACTTHHGTYTLLSKNIVNLDHLDISKAKRTKNVEGVSSSHIVIFFPFGELNPNIESAMSDAFEKVDGDLFVNATVKERSFYIPYIYGQHSVIVEGDVIKTH